MIILGHIQVIAVYTIRTVYTIYASYSTVIQYTISIIYNILNIISYAYTGNGSQEGKQPYMASAAYELSAKYNIDITRRSTLLVDDDFRNIQIALKYKTPAIRFEPENVDK